MGDKTKNGRRLTSAARPLVYEQVAQAVIDMLRSDGYRKGDRLPSERKISELLSINYLSVRRGMLLLVEQGMIERHVGQGTFLLLEPEAIQDIVGVNRTAGLLTRDSARQPREAKFAVVLLEPYEPFHLELVGEVLADLGRLGCGMSYCATNSTLPRIQSEIELYSKQGVTGAVLLNTSDTERASRKLVALCRNASVPLVLAKRYENLPDYFYGVKHNLCAGWNEFIFSRLGCAYLAGLGVKHMYYLTPPVGVSLTRRRRVQGFLGSARDYPVKSEVLESPIRRKELASFLSRLKRARGEAAVFCYDDETAVGFMMAAANAGLSVPQDVAVLGANNIRVSSMADPAITTMTFDYAYISRSIVCKLLSSAGFKAPVWPMPSAPRLIVRESCGIHDRLNGAEAIRAYTKGIQDQVMSMMNDYRSVPTVTSVAE